MSPTAQNDVAPLEANHEKRHGNSNERGVDEIIRFAPDEEKALVDESLAHKNTANSHFAASRFPDAIVFYNKALSSCPIYLYYQVAVIRSNLAACHLKLENWKDTVKEAGLAIEALDKCQKELDVAKSEDVAADSEVEKLEHENADKDENEDVDEEIISEGATKAAQPPKPESKSPTAPTPQTREARIAQQKSDINRIRAKSLMRRARAYSSLGGWSNLSNAQDDYKLLAAPEMDTIISAADRKMVRAQLDELPARTKQAQEKETAEMMGKLKDLGNTFLKPFGLSTNNFQFQKDESTGGYNMNFKQG